MLLSERLPNKLNPLGAVNTKSEELKHANKRRTRITKGNERGEKMSNVARELGLGQHLS